MKVIKIKIGSQKVQKIKKVDTKVLVKLNDFYNQFAEMSGGKLLLTTNSTKS